MGRLFWKILITFWLTLLATALLAGGSVWLMHQARSSDMVWTLEPPPDFAPPLAEPHIASDRPPNQPVYRPKLKPPRPIYRDPFWLLIVAGLLVSLISSALLAWYFVKPLRSLRLAFQHLAQGNLDWRVSPDIGSRRDEIADLGHDFDHMAGQLQTLMASQQNLLHDVSHELRSPLARLQVSVGLARQQPERVGISLNRIEQEAGRLDKLVGELLTLSRLEAGVPEVMDEYLDVLELLAAVLDDARFEAGTYDRHIELLQHTNENLVMRGHGELLYRALENVVRNAIKHTPPDTTVLISTWHDSLKATFCIWIDDHGPGVPESELELIFKPFRQGSWRSGQNGYGLGLAIARRAIETHHGSIRPINRPEGGLRMEIVFPLHAE